MSTRKNSVNALLCIGLIFSANCFAQTSLYIDEFSNVGIGTDFPTEKLHLFTGDTELKMRLEQGGSTNAWAYSVVNSNPIRPDAFRISKQGTGGPEVDIIGRFDPGGEPTMQVAGSIEATNITFSSSREWKTSISPLDGQEVLSRLVSLPLARWRLKTEDASAIHYGPMAEDFNAAFELTGNNKTISVVDANGIAFAAIQGLVTEVEKRDAKIEELANDIAALRELVHSLIK